MSRNLPNFYLYVIPVTSLPCRAVGSNVRGDVISLLFSSSLYRELRAGPCDGEPASSALPASARFLGHCWLPCGGYKVGWRWTPTYSRHLMQEGRLFFLPRPSCTVLRGQILSPSVVDKDQAAGPAGGILVGHADV